MKVHSVEAYFIRYHEACYKHLKNYALKASTENLHCIRVSIKKIKAAFALTQNQDGLDVEAYFAAYRNIFHQAGVIREATLIRDKLAGLSTDKKAISHRTHHLAVLNKKFKADIPSYLKDIKEGYEDIIAALRMYDFDISPIAKDMLKKLKKKWRKTHAVGNYHSLRKHLKEFSYTASILQKDERNKMISPKDLKRIDKLQDLIGLWHDDIDIGAHILSDVRDAKSVERKIKDETKKLHKKIKRTGEKLWG